MLKLLIHIVHVELDREEEGRFYKSAKNIKRFHQITVTKDGMEGKEISHGNVESIVLGDVRERKSKRALELKAKKQPKNHSAFVNECQKCHNQMKKGEVLEEWIQCDSCDRSWHKTCVGYRVDVSANEIEWSKCKNCGGDDPEGDILNKRRKVQSCVVCGKRIKGFDHKNCKAQRVEEATTFRTPKAVVISQLHHQVGRKIADPAKEKRSKRKIKKKRKNSGQIVSESQYKTFMNHV